MRSTYNLNHNVLFAVYHDLKIEKQCVEDPTRNIHNSSCTDAPAYNLRRVPKKTHVVLKNYLHKIAFMCPTSIFFVYV